VNIVWEVIKGWTERSGWEARRRHPRPLSGDKLAPVLIVRLYPGCAEASIDPAQFTGLR
jgi:hypothetical protein